MAPKNEFLASSPSSELTDQLRSDSVDVVTDEKVSKPRNGKEINDQEWTPIATKASSSQKKNTRQSTQANSRASSSYTAKSAPANIYKKYAYIFIRPFTSYKRTIWFY